MLLCLDSTSRFYPLEDVGSLVPKVNFLWRVDDAFIIQDGQRFSNQIALNLFADFITQDAALCFGFDALRNVPVAVEIGRQASIASGH